MDGYKLVMDVSHHVRLNYDLVKKYVDGFIIRFGFGVDVDTMSEQHYNGLKDKPCAGYQWFRPDQDIKMQIELVKQRVGDKNIKVFFSDQEQKGIYNISTSTYSPDLLSERGRAHVEGLALHGFDMGVYSRATWVSQYAKPMLSWLPNYYNWLASWPYASGAVNTTWEYLMSFWAPKTFSPYYTADFLQAHRVAKAWQWSGDKFIVPGVTTSTGIPRSSDFNFVRDDLFERFITGGVIAPPVIPDPIIESTYNELGDLISSMLSGKLEIDSRLMKDINKLIAIRSVMKPGG